MAKGNDGNYLQHCIEVEAAVRLAQADPSGRLHVALTHGMAPFEKLEELNVKKDLLYGALREAAGEPKSDEREIVKAYRVSWRSQAYRPNIANLFQSLRAEKHYPNSAELLRAVIGKEQLFGGITEVCATKHKELEKAWGSSKVNVEHSSWRRQLGPGDALSCPDRLESPWLFSMDPMTYSEGGRDDDDKLHCSDLSLLEYGLRPYFDSEQPGIACFFVFGMKGTQNGKKLQSQFWVLIDELARRLDATTGSYWVQHIGGSRNLAGLLFSDEELAGGFGPPRIKPGRCRSQARTSNEEFVSESIDVANPERWSEGMKAERTGECWCGCGRPTASFFSAGCDLNAQRALLDIVYGSGATADRLAKLGFGPHNSVIEARDMLNEIREKKWGAN